MLRIKLTIKLQRLLVVALLLVLLPAVAVQAWYSYRMAQDFSVKFQEQLAGEVSARVFDKVLHFFEIPNQVVRYNAEQFRAGLLDIANPQETQRNFLLQLRQQPMLTFVSMGTVAGEYYAASRPPIGEDRELRMVQSTEAEGYAITHYRITPDNKRGALISRDKGRYDPRLRPWFKAAQGYDIPRWYGAYRYAPYDAMGIGMAAPLYNGAGEFVGVMTADVALLQLNQLLSAITHDLGGTAFLFDEGGALLATSTTEQLYELKGSETIRVSAAESSNPLIRVASNVIHGQAGPRGRTVEMADGERYLVDWWKYPLPEGPTITIASMLPQSKFDALPRGLTVNVILFSAAVMLISLTLALIMSKLVSKPLVELAKWATKLGRGEQAEVRRGLSPIAEVESLFNALQFMAESIRFHTDNLENEVAARTTELELVNLELAKRSNTDGLTGLANRRYFDEILEQEMARAHRHKESLALILLDVDYFKKYNDHYGHVAGDGCLIRIASVLKDYVRRPGDVAARYGGEEFAVILPYGDIGDALALASILRQKIEGMEIPHTLAPTGVVTASFGVAAFIPDESKGSLQLIEMADKALYQAKKSGRNCIEPVC